MVIYIIANVLTIARIWTIIFAGHINQTNIAACPYQSRFEEVNMFCSNCGANLQENAKFCPACGAAVAPDSAVVPIADKQETRPKAIKDVCEYLHNLVELEKAAYLQETVISELNQKINSLGIRGSFPAVSMNDHDHSKPGAYALAGMLIGAIVGVIIGFLVSCGSCDSVSHAISSAFSLNWLKSMLIGAGIGAGLGLVIGLIAGIISMANEKSENKEEYEDALAIQNSQIAADNARVERELSQAAFLKGEKAKMEEQHRETKKTLQEFYDNGPIYEKYRNLPAVASFYDYFRSGRCKTFGERHGVDGAYNIYENELNQKMIISKLDIVVNKLDQIKENQYSLYEAIQSGNALTSQLINSTDRVAQGIERNNELTAISNYNQQQATAELSQIRWLEERSWLRDEMN